MRNFFIHILGLAIIQGHCKGLPTALAKNLCYKIPNFFIPSLYLRDPGPALAVIIPVQLASRNQLFDLLKNEIDRFRVGSFDVNPRAVVKQAGIHIIFHTLSFLS